VLPIILDPHRLVAGLAGEGAAWGRRLEALRAAGVEPVPVAADARDFGGLGLLYIAGLDLMSAVELAGRARAARVLVNVEDRPELCDFHVPAVVRQGDLVIAVSTGGLAPALARQLRAWLGERFGPEWKDRVEKLGAARASWRAQGVSGADISERTRRLIDGQGWLP